ncbi:concanavalin A-like lectin/glucanase domain-containing protein [Podospora didyma]|uniref:Concanavalin A-like lectin/glucanase domain-containing protein n=1 Tax=Podospora didyma TaxID=330526 RepID=A0AAE0N9D4_9PEZI|nr:concanavalin A-like lectin/glucanase domain-containing protein [Podospora didyma]
MRSPSSIAVLVASLAHAQAQYLVNELSFGFGTRISPEGQQSVPNFSLQGRPNVPELLSNKIILTPPAPGNQRGAVWADKSLPHQNWIADVDFRANGPERGGGNLNIWLVRDGAHNVGSGSIYTVGKFEGLALVIDQSGGSGGMIRGFLNDGTTDFQKHHNPDNLAFGHCQFSYRNLGRPSQIKMRHSESKFVVEVDSHLCFESDKIRLPSGYNFGITAASAENPDSFEVFKLVVLNDDNNHGSTSSYHQTNHGQNQDQNQNQNQNQNQGQNQGHENNNNQQAGQQQKPPHQGKLTFGRSGMVVDDPFDTVIPDQQAEKITSSKAQFEDLHNRLQSVNHHLSSIFRAVSQVNSIGEQRHEEVSTMLGELKGLITTKVDHRCDALESKLANLEKEMRSLRNELAAKLRDSENSIKYHVSDHHETLKDTVQKHAAPGHTRLILVIVGGQLLLAAGYVYYKRRKSSPKKYL